MNALIYSILGGVIATLLSGVGGYYVGQLDGEAAGKNAATVVQLSEQNKQQAQALQSLISSAEQHQSLIEQSNKASQKLRQAAARQTRTNRKQLQALKNELETTKAARVNCIVPANSVQHIQNAREQAIQSATGAAQ